MWAELVLPDYLALLAFLIALLRHRQFRPILMKGFVPLLALIIVVEWGAADGYYIIDKSNSWIFNILTTIDCCFYFFLFSYLLKNSKVKAIALFSVFTFPIAVLFNCAFFQGFNTLHTNTFAIGSLLIIAFTCTYFYELLQSPGEMRLFIIPFFWVCSGLLFYYAGDFVMTIIFPHLIKVKDKSFNKLINTIESVLNTLLYCCFIIAFLCQRKTTNSFT